MNTLAFIPPAKKRNAADSRRKGGDAAWQEQQYPNRLNSYRIPPTADITLEQFEQWAIDRLRVLAELEACSFRNRSPAETATYMKPLLDKYLPLDSNSSASSAERLHNQRQKDHYSHFILRLAFCSTPDLRRRFSRSEAMLFRLRLQDELSDERKAFMNTLNLDWVDVEEDERLSLLDELNAVSFTRKGEPEETQWKKVSWVRVPELVEQRRVYLRKGMAYIPSKEQAAMAASSFVTELDESLTETLKRLPNLDEDDRLSPILAHLSKNFITPDSSYTGAQTRVGEVSARNIDTLAQHYPMCMAHLHHSLRRDAHLKHYGRLQYTLFLKGIGLSLDECLVFWREAFHRITDDTFNKEYRYNVRHAYGDVGGDGNRRGGGYSPFSCQKILTEHPPGPGEAHGCPYRHFDADNLTAMLQARGIKDRAVLAGVVQDKEKQKYHIACNRVFEYLHKPEIKRAKDEGIMTAAQLETIVHPNEYFKRSYLLNHLNDKPDGEDGDVKMGGS